MTANRPPPGYITLFAGDLVIELREMRPPRWLLAEVLEGLRRL